MASELPAITPEQYRVETTTYYCEIDGGECDGYDACTTCSKAQDYAATEEARELEALIPNILRSERKEGAKGYVNSRYTMMTFESIDDCFAELNIQRDVYESLAEYDDIDLQAYYPEFYNLLKRLNYKKPASYLFRKDFPLIAIYDKVIYVVAPIIPVGE